MFQKKDRILVIAAHPDDEVLGCGGTIKKYISAGLDVKVIILGEGSSCRFNSYKSKINLIKKSILQRNKNID